MSEQDPWDRLHRAGRRLIAADHERVAALAEATSAIHDVADAPLTELVDRSGLSTGSIHALLVRDERDLHTSHPEQRP